MNEGLIALVGFHGEDVDYVMVFPRHFGGDDRSGFTKQVGELVKGYREWSDGFTITYESSFGGHAIVINGRRFEFDAGRLFLCGRRDRELVVLQLHEKVSTNEEALKRLLNEDSRIVKFFEDQNAPPVKQQPK